MASFDIKSIFTNIPLDETMDIIIFKSFNNSTHFHNFTYDDFSKLLRFAVKNSHFLFNGVLYEQTDGVAMGSPLGPVFADTFLSCHECPWLSNCPSQFKPLYYRRYVDCFLLFDSPNHIKPFLDYMNCQHPRIVFTQETEENNSLSFLNILITRQNGSFTTSVCQKPTFTGLYTNFNSFLPFIFKKGFLFTLLNPYFNICSSYVTFSSQLNFFKKIFLLNGYPEKLIDYCIRSYLDKIFSPRPKISLTPKKVIYFCLPYTGQHRLQTSTQIRKLCSSAFPQLSIRFVFRPCLRLTHFFSFGDRIPKSLRSRMANLFKCQR